MSFLAQYEDVTPLCEKGHVVLVRDRRDGQLYVKKTVRSYDPGIYRRLREHPVKNLPVICAVEQNGVRDGGAELTIIEEYCAGATLAEHLARHGCFTEAQTVDIGLQLCRILMDLHAMRPAIIHRDIKPSNVMLLPDGTVKLLDLNAAKTETANERRDTVLLGTAGFAAPEQYGFSSSTPQTDLYAVGVLLNTMLTGALPWQKRAGGRLRPVIDRCLKLNPKDRYAGAWELYAVLKKTGREKLPFLPPGFRTLKWYKMLPAALWYLFVLIFALRADVSDYPIAAERFILRSVFFLLGTVPVFFYGNYMGVQRWFPLQRSPRRWLRAVGMLLSPAILSLALVLYIGLAYLLLMP